MLSLKFKKFGSENTSRQREHPRRDKLQLELGKNTRELPSTNIGPKRLKVKGPSILGLGSRLD